MKAKVIVAGLCASFLLLVGYSIFSSRQADTLPQNGHGRGPEAARVEVVEFCDLQQRQCRETHLLIEELMGKYQDKIRLIFRHYPITAIHRQALPAALAAEAAGEQGKFWEYVSVLLEQQEVWSTVVDPRDLFLAYAAQVSLPDVERFKREFQAQAHKQRVLADLRLGNQVGAYDIPFFLVNGEEVSAEGLKLAVERVISKP